MRLDEAFRYCERETWRQARNFAYGIRLLPADRRAALSALYAFARRADDIADGPLPTAQKRAELARLRRALDRWKEAGEDPVLVALAATAERYPLPCGALHELLDGVEMDVAGTFYESFPDLLVYCRRVAGTVGRLSLSVFEPEASSQAHRAADALGVALQLTNILRDLLEDHAMGRVYLPACDLERFGCHATFPEPHDGFRDLIRFEAARAREWFDRGFELLPHLDARARACVSAMAGIYARLLDRIDHDPECVLAGRISLPAWEKTWVAVRSLGGAWS